MVKVTVKDGVITRMRPLRLTEEDGGHWTIEAKGKKFSDPRKTTINPFNIAERTRVYSENRIKYPMKRKNFDPNGERHPELRGKDEYVRITWDEALDLVASEIKRVQSTYGKAAITAFVSSHHNYGLLYYKMGPMPRFYNILGYTQLLDNPDSWEGWHWGSMHTWGWYWRFGQCDCFDMLAEAMKNTEQVVYWSVDPNTSAGGYGGQETVIWREWLRELGIGAHLHRPLLQRHRRAHGRQVAGPPARHRRRSGGGHRLPVDHGRHLRPLVRREPHRVLRRVEGLHPGQDRRYPQVARSGRPPSATSRRTPSRRSPGSGCPRRPCWPPAPCTARPAPAATPMPPSGAA